MRFIWRSALKDLRRQINDPLALLLWLGIPIAIVLLIYMAFGRSDAPPKAHLLVVDGDDSFVSQMLMSSLDRVPVIDVETVQLDAGTKRIRAGKATALLIIPDGFGTAVFEEKPTTLRLITNPAQRILPGIVEETLDVLVEGSFYAQRLVGDPLRQIAAGPPPGANVLADSAVAAISIQFNRVADRLSNYLFPPAIELETRTEARGSGLGLGQLFFPSILFMSLLFIADGMSGDVWKEASYGTLRRVRTAPQHLAAFLGGKILAAAIFIAAIGLAAIAIGTTMFDLAWKRLPVGLLWVTFTGVVFVALLSLIQMYATTQRTAGILTTVIIFPLMMLGGAFFPFEAMPAWLARIGRRSPNGWALEQFKQILWGTVEPASLAIAFVALLGVGALAFALGVRRLGRGFAGGA